MGGRRANGKRGLISAAAEMAARRRNNETRSGGRFWLGGLGGQLVLRLQVKIAGVMALMQLI
jgi:hypothetical protein